MKIALFTSNRTTVPPEKNVIAASAALTGVLADALAEAGHDVTLYAPKGSTSKAKIIDLGLEPPGLDYALIKEEWVKNLNLGWKQYYIGELFKDADKYDIIHLQTEPVYLGMHFSKTTKTPTVYTNHNVFVPQEAGLLQQYKHLPIVTISNYQKSSIPDLNYIGTVYNGIDVESFPFVTDPDEYMYITGRIVPQKGFAEAIEIAQITGHTLIMSGRDTGEYVEKNLRPHLSEKIQYVGQTSRESDQWYELYGKAKVTLMPIQWEEPFGLVMIESMACGTPVVGFARGAVPEIVEDGVTGFVVNPSDDEIRGDFVIKKTGMEGMKEAVERIYSMDTYTYGKMRINSRKRVEDTFSVEKMIQGYLNVYAKVIKAAKGELQ